MKQIKYILPVIIISILITSNCKKDKDNDESSDRFNLLVSHTWQSDSLIANGQPSGGAGEPLEKFAGETKFNKDGTGYIGTFTGIWSLINNDKEISIRSEELSFYLTVKIVELKKSSLVVSMQIPGFYLTGDINSPLMDVRMTFIPK